MNHIWTRRDPCFDSLTCPYPLLSRCGGSLSLPLWLAGLISNQKASNPSLTSSQFIKFMKLAQHRPLGRSLMFGCCTTACPIFDWHQWHNKLSESNLLWLLRRLQGRLLRLLPRLRQLLLTRVGLVIGPGKAALVIATLPGVGHHFGRIPLSPGSLCVILPPDLLLISRFGWVTWILCSRGFWVAGGTGGCLLALEMTNTEVLILHRMAGRRGDPGLVHLPTQTWHLSGLPSPHRAAGRAIGLPSPLTIEQGWWCTLHGTTYFTILSRPLKGTPLPWLLEGTLWLKRLWSTCLKTTSQRMWSAPSSHSIHLEKTPSSTLNPKRSSIRKIISIWRWTWILLFQSSHCKCMDPCVPSVCQVCSQFLLHVSTHQRNWLIERQSIVVSLSLSLFSSHQSSSPLL